MNKIIIGRLIFYYRPSCSATLETIYGIGRVKAKKINSFLLNHPVQKYFQDDIISLMIDSSGYFILSKLFIDKKVRLYVCYQLMHKIYIFCYQAYRLFQALPTRGQRTKANAGTPSRLNPYLSLQINPNFYPNAEIIYRRRELFYNGRHQDLKNYNTMLKNKEKTRKADRKAQDKLTKQNYIRDIKLGKIPDTN